MAGRTINPGGARKPVVEPLEARLLFSADPLGLIPVDLLDSTADKTLSENHVLVTAAQVAGDADIREVVFISRALPDYQTLLDGIMARSSDVRSLAVHLLDDSEDGIGFVGDRLAQYSELDAVHFITHGSDSALYLGGSVINGEMLSGLSGELAGWGDALGDEADLLFYGCDLAASDSGRAMLAGIARLTGADVAASDNASGHARYNADWRLEHHEGVIEAQPIVSEGAQLAWDSTLAVVNVSSTIDEVDGSNGQTSLREAIRDAADFDIIQLDDARYELSLPGPDDNSGDLDIYRSITIRGVEGGNTTIDANSIHRVLHIYGAGVNVVLQDLTISGGYVTTLDGAGIYVERGGLELLRVNVQDNENVHNDGGGVFVGASGTLLVADSNISKNTAGSVSAGTGGGIYSVGDVSLLRVNMDLNRSTYGGALYNGGSMDISHSSISDNVALINGGAIRSFSGSLHIDSVSFIDNISLEGGAMYLNTDAQIVNSTFSGNSAQLSNGGAIRVSGSADMQISHSSFVDNSAAVEGGALSIASSARVSLSNSLFADNTAGGLPAAISGVVDSAGFNLIEDPGFADADGMTDLVGVDAGVVALADNGGFALTHALLAGSAAIDAAGGESAEDQSAAPRNEIPDIGAFEYRSASPDGVLYWTSADAKAIYRASAESSEPQAYQKILDTSFTPFDIEIDMVNRRIYWVEADAAYAENGGLGSIMSAGLDGSAVSTLVSGLKFPTGLALDIAQGFIYVTTNHNTLTPGLPAENQILRYRLDGSFSRVIAQAADSAAAPDRMVAPTDVDYDASSNRLFWTDRGTGALDGREVKVISLSPPGDPDGALGTPVPLYSGPYNTGQAPHALVLLQGGDEFYFATGSGIYHYNTASATGSYSGDLTASGDLLGLSYASAAQVFYYTDHSGNVYRINSDLSSASVVFSGLSAPGSIAHATFQAVSLPPVLQINTGATVAEGGTLVLDTTMLSASDPDDGLAVRFTLQAAPAAASGVLSSDGVALGVGDSFTQADLLAGKLVYTHSGAEDTADSFEFRPGDEDNLLAAETFNLTITPVNDAPDALSATLAATIEDASDPAGATLASLFGGSFSDPDSGAVFAGVAVVDNPQNSAQGSWQYSTDGSQWHDIAQVLETAALRLSESSLIRFLPAANFSGPVSPLSVRVIDDSATQLFPSYADVSVNGGSSAFSASLLSIATEVLALNDPPDISDVILPPVYESTQSAPGQSVEQLFQPVYADIDSGPLIAGIAIVGNAGSGGGQWAYSVDGGGSWQAVGSVSASDALVLERTALLRFEPVSGYSGSPDPLSLHALDDSYTGPYSSLVQRHSMDTTGLPPGSPLSSTQATLATLVLPISHAPAGKDAVLSTDEDMALVLGVADFGFSDPLDKDSLHSVRIETLPTAGELRFAGSVVTAGQSFSRSELESAQLVFQPGANASAQAYASFTFFVTDTGSTAHGGVVQALSPNRITIDVQELNDSPGEIRLDQQLVTENEAGAVVGTLSTTDPDPGDSVVIDVDDPRFEVVGATLQLRPGQSLDYETAQQIPLTLTATDAQGASVQNSFVLQVRNVNEAPQLASAPAAQLASAPWSFSLPADTFVDPDGDALSYSASLLDGSALPDWLLFDAASLQFSVASGAPQQPGLELLLLADDGNGATASTILSLTFETVTVPVTPPVTQPVTPPVTQPVTPPVTQPVTPPVTAPTEPPVPAALPELPPEQIPGPLPVQAFEASQPETPAVSPHNINKASSAAQITEVREVQATIRVPSSTESVLPDIELTDSQQGSRAVAQVTESGDGSHSRKQIEKRGTAGVIAALDSTPLSLLFQFEDSDAVAMYAYLRDLLEQEQESSERDAAFARKVVGTSVTVSSGISVGYVLWLIRSGTLVGSVLSTLPAWRFIDPLPVLDSLDYGDEDDSESLETLVDAEPDHSCPRQPDSADGNSQPDENPAARGD